MKTNLQKEFSLMKSAIRKMDKEYLYHSSGYLIFTTDLKIAYFSNFRSSNTLSLVFYIDANNTKKSFYEQLEEEYYNMISFDDNNTQTTKYRC